MVIVAAEMTSYNIYLQKEAQVLLKKSIHGKLTFPEKKKNSDETKNPIHQLLRHVLMGLIRPFSSCRLVAQRRDSFRKEHANVRCGLCPLVLFSTV